MKQKDKHIKQYCVEGNDDVYVLYSEQWTEVDIHSRLLMRIGIMCDHVEGISTKSEVTIHIGKAFNRIDIMVFKGKLPICGVEVKKSKTINNPVQHKKQSEFYKAFEKFTSVPIYYCYGFEDIKSTAAKVYNFLYNKYNPKKCNNEVVDE